MMDIKNFESYGREATFIFDSDSVENTILNEYWENIDDPVNLSIERLLIFDPYKACVLCRVIGACVEYDFESPTLDLIPKFCERLTDLCLEFIDDFCKAKGLPDDDEDAIAEALSACEHDELMKINPDGHRACMGHYDMIRSVMAVIMRNRKRLDALTGYFDKFNRLAYILDKFNYLARAVSLCDSEKIIVINPETQKGWECITRHIENNFCLMSLLQFSFYHKGILKELGAQYRYNEDMDMYAHNRFDFNKELPSDAEEAALGFYTYYAYKGDGICNAFTEGNKIDTNAWIWGEMPVTSIPKIGDYRIILVDKKVTPARSWNLGFLSPVHPAIQPEFEVVKIIEKNEVTGLLEKIYDKNSK
jgi:hypothetical protein